MVNDEMKTINDAIVLNHHCVCLQSKCVDNVLNNLCVTTNHHVETETVIKNLQDYPDVNSLKCIQGYRIGDRIQQKNDPQNALAFFKDNGYVLIFWLGKTLEIEVMPSEMYESLLKEVTTGKQRKAAFFEVYTDVLCSKKNIGCGILYVVSISSFQIIVVLFMICL